MDNKFVEVILSIEITLQSVECAGPAFYRATRLANGLLHKVEHEDLSKLPEDEDEFIVSSSYLKSLDPKEWKDQDHYKVLGLAHLRINATDDDIRRAYRRMVLQHHPDKRKAKGEEVNQDTDYFTCITKANEILGSTKTRRAYDSVDPDFDDALPTTSQIESDYYGVFNKYFDLNARWSEKKPVPAFGDTHAQRADVDNFYNFWYEFKSWREFSYLDEEDKDRGQDRDERRWIEKENKVQRIKRKKEEMTRIRTLVDLAYNNDKRIAKFKEDEKQRKLAAKRAKIDAAQAQRIEQERVARECQLERERLEKAEQKRIEQIRIERDQMKRALKKERKCLRDKAKECKYFSSNDKELLSNMEGVERICENYNLGQLQELNREFYESNAKCNDIYYKTITELDSRLKCLTLNSNGMFKQYDTTPITTTTSVTPKTAKTAEVETTTTSETTTTTPVNLTNGFKDGGIREVKKKEVIWTPEVMQLLIKAVNLFPAGTAQRWDVVAAFINQHQQQNDIVVCARDVLNKAKALQSSDFSKSALKKQANDTAYENFEKISKKLEQPTSDDITVNNLDNNNKKQHQNENKTKNNHLSTNNVVTKKNHEKSQNNSKETSEKIQKTKTPTTTELEKTKTPTINCDNNDNMSLGGDKENFENGAKPMVNGLCNNVNNKMQNMEVEMTDEAATNGMSSRTWTEEEQALLEQAIKTYPIQTAERWELIASCIPNRSKKDCLRRVKELVGIVNAKKEAKQAVK